jgi:hypothetical protein
MTLARVLPTTQYLKREGQREERGMRVTVASRTESITGRLGPLCIACGNTKRFWIHSPEGDQLAEMSELPEGEVRVTACGRCSSRNSIVIAHVD